MGKSAVTQMFLKAFDSTLDEVCRHLSDHNVNEQDQWSGLVAALDQFRDAAMAVDAEEIAAPRFTVDQA